MQNLAKSIKVCKCCGLLNEKRRNLVAFVHQATLENEYNANRS
jgi:hypothetical protein